MQIEKGPRGPIIPGAPDRDITTLVNQVIQKGPECLDLGWLDEVPLAGSDAQNMYLFFDGKTAVNALQGAILSPLLDRVIQVSPAREPFGLVYDASRNLGRERRYKIYQTLASFGVERWSGGRLLDPYGQLYLALNDTLEHAFDMHITALHEKRERGLAEPLVQSLYRLEQLDKVARTIDPNVASPLQQMEGGIGSGSAVVAAVSKIIPLLLEKFGVTDVMDKNSAVIAGNVAENTTATITNLAMLDNHSFTDIVPSWFLPILNNFTPDLLSRFILVELKGKGFAVDLSDEAKEDIIDIYNQWRESYIPRTGCPFRATIAHERDGKIVSTAGVVDLWKFASPARQAIYADQYRMRQNIAA